MRTQRALFTLMILLVSSSGMFAGTVKGRVTYTGAPAKQRQIDMSKEPSCAKQHATPVSAESIVTGPNNALENVVVYVSSGVRDDDQVPAQAITFEQKGCQYIPHVLVMHTNQKFKIVNNDDATHNIHPLAKINREWNKSQPPGSAPLTGKYEKEEFIPVKCNIHPWMHGNFVVLKTSHYDVSKGSGGFKLPDLPPGKYTLTAWHEQYGTETADVTITGKETKEINFTFKAKTY
jgi:Carboxypeptidase regulatory-like domain